MARATRRGRKRIDQSVVDTKPQAVVRGTRKRLGRSKRDRSETGCKDRWCRGRCRRGPDPNPRASTEPAWPRLSLERYAERKAQLFLRQLLLPAFVFLLAFLLLLLFLLACLFRLAFLLLFLSRRAESRGHLGVTRGLERRWREAPGRSREPGNRYGRRSATAVGLGRSSTPTTLDSDVRVGSTVRPRPSHATARHVTTAVNASASARRQRKCPSN